LNHHALFSDLDDSHHFILTSKVLQPIVGSGINRSDVAVDLWADVLGGLSLVEVVVLKVDLITRLRHLVSG
jgi:hypothetical protein